MQQDNLNKAHIRNSGVSLVEVLVGVALFLIAVLFLTSSYLKYLEATFRTIPNIQAIYLLEEGVEALKIMRGSSWSGQIVPLADGTEYYFYWTGTTWSATTTPIYVGGMKRTLVMSPVYRDINNDIDLSGSFDADTKKGTFTVEWSRKNATSSKTVDIIIANIFAN